MCFGMGLLTSLHHLKRDSLDYAVASITSKLNAQFDWGDIPNYRDFHPRNSFLDILLPIDTNVDSNLYCLLHQNGNHILGELETKWEEKPEIKLSSNEISRSFLLFTV